MRVFILVALLAGLFFGALRLSGNASANASANAENTDPIIEITSGLSVAAGEMITVPIRFDSGSQEVAGIGFSLDFDPACLAFDEIDEDGNGLPDAVTFDLSPQFFPSVSYDSEDDDGELDVLIADYTPPLATLADSDRLISVRFVAVCQPANPQGDATLIEFSSQPAVSFSSPSGQPVNGVAARDSVLILVQPDFTPQPTPTATATAPPTATPDVSPTATPVPVPGNRPPIVVNDAVTTNEDTSVSIAVLQNDSDPDGDTLSVEIAIPPAHGRALLNASGMVTYLPDADFNGNDSFVYAASDGRGETLFANVNITVRAVNDPPVILIAPNDQTNKTGEIVMLLISANDIDTAQEALSFAAEGLPHGVILEAEQEWIRGTIGENAAGTYTVVITVSDGSLQDRVQFQWVVIGDETVAPIYLPIIRK